MYGSPSRLSSGELSFRKAFNSKDDFYNVLWWILFLGLTIGLLVGSLVSRPKLSRFGQLQGEGIMAFVALTYISCLLVYVSRTRSWKRCPECKEKIRTDARKCRYCRSEVPEKAES